MNGPQVLYVIPVLGGIAITETVRNAWIAMAVLIVASLWLTYDMKIVPSRRQAAAEMIVSTVYGLVDQTMGSKGKPFAPYIGTLFFFSLSSSLMSLFGFRPPTGDINTTLCWALIFFFMVQTTKIRKNGPIGYLKGFFDPIPLIFPLNFIGEFSTPISMMFRHFGNIFAGLAISSLMYSGLAAASGFLLGWFTNIPILQLGLPAVLSIYFDLFTSVLQALIFCMLTMVFVSGAME